jgi:hypothetical protein
MCIALHEPNTALLKIIIMSFESNINLNLIIMSAKKVVTTKSKRFAIKKNLLGKGVIFEFKNLKGQVCIYDHDAVYEAEKKRFQDMPCFVKYKIYTNTNNLPKFVRDLDDKIARIVE